MYIEVIRVRGNQHWTSKYDWVCVQTYINIHTLCSQVTTIYQTLFGIFEQPNRKTPPIYVVCSSNASRTGLCSNMSKYLYLTFRNEKYLYLNTFLKYLTFSNTFKSFFKYPVCINISVSRSHVMPVKLITFTATSPNSANYWWRHCFRDPGSDLNFCLLRDRGWISTWQ